MIFPRPTPEQTSRRIWDEAAASIAAGIPAPWVEVVEPDAPDLYVSESEARWLQQRADNLLERDAS